MWRASWEAVVLPLNYARLAADLSQPARRAARRSEKSRAEPKTSLPASGLTGWRIRAL